ncbi:MAG: efflux RND transporter periplasmic adaptor subunit [Pseudomonadales bacterium]|nr:efflux RND transporter periplasmic adaptor subunit [Pseudomonadales bacterium]
MKRLVIPFFIILAGFGLAAGLVLTGPTLQPAPQQVSAPLVRVQQVVPNRVQLSTFTHGTIVPRTESELVPEVAGRIIQISDSMVSGGFFKQGDILIRIDPLDYEVALQQAKAGLTRALSELENARKSHQRQLNLANKQSTSASQKDDAFNRLRIAQASTDDARARLSRAERDLTRTLLIAPYDGRVRSEHVDVGQFVKRGNTVASLYATDYVEVRLPIHDEELAYLDLSLAESNAPLARPVKVTLRARFAGNDHEWQGTVVRTEGELDPRTRMINVVASIAAPYAVAQNRPPLSVGLFVEAEIQGSEVENVVILPRLALRGEQQVYVVDRNNQLRIRPVQVLRIVDDQVYINAGLAAGDKVCLSALDNIFDGMPVRLLTSKQVVGS